MNKSLLAAALAASALLGFATSAGAVPAVVAGTVPEAMPPGTVIVQTAPPPPVYEAAPPLRPGYTWAPGHYEWRGDRYAWLGGRWMETRPGYAWRDAHWVQRADGSWFMVAGHWRRSDNVSYNERWYNDPYYRMQR